MRKVRCAQGEVWGVECGVEWGERLIEGGEEGGGRLRRFPSRPAHFFLCSPTNSPPMPQPRSSTRCPGCSLSSGSSLRVIASPPVDTKPRPNTAS